MAHKPITFHLVAAVLTADGGNCVCIPYPPGVTRDVTVTDYATDLPQEAQRLVTQGEAAIRSMATGKKDVVIGARVSAFVKRGQIAPRGFNKWSEGRNPSMRFDWVEA